MKLLESNIASQVVKQSKSDVGTLHFFDHVAIVEFDEGMHIDLSTANKTINDLFEYFGNSEPFGFISNRVNSYSISIMDVPEVKSIFPNMIAYGVVCQNEAGRMNARMESEYCTCKNITFDDLYEGLDKVSEIVKKRLTTPSLN